MATAVSPTPQPVLIFDTLLAYERTAALKAAIELDLFRAIGAGPGDVASLARACSASERGIRILCDYLAIMGLIVKEDGRYKHSPTSAAFLDPNSPACLASIAKFLGNSTMNSPFHQLAEIVRSGRTTLPGQGSVEPDNPVWVEFAESMAPMMAPMAKPLAEISLAGLTGPVRVLDIAAGHGLFSIAVAQHNPEARAVALDWPNVLEVAMANARKAGVADRVEKLPGSAFDVDYGGPYDAVLLTNFLHHFDPPTCTGLLKKVRAALKPGGRAAILEVVPNEDRISPPVAAGFSLVMLATTAAGDAYTYREFEKMLLDAGFGQISADPIPMSPHTIVMGRNV